MKIAIITGGETEERNISIKSAENIKKLIDFTENETFVFPEEKERFLDSYKDFDIVFPIIHGVGGEDGSLQKWLDELNVRYIFSGPEPHAIGINKKLSKKLAESIGVKVATETKNLPLFAKPNTGGSSVASGVCNSKEDLERLLEENPNTEFILEELISGREFTVGIIDHAKKTFPLPVIEIIPKGEFFDFENKYDPKNLASEICPADIDTELANQLRDTALKIHKEIGARHISRSDFIVTSQNEIYFLEINTIPGMTETSLVPKMLNQINISLRGLLKEWIKQCTSR